jgi:hypothetical protein
LHCIILKHSLKRLRFPRKSYVGIFTNCNISKNLNKIQGYSAATDINGKHLHFNSVSKLQFSIMKSALRDQTILTHSNIHKGTKVRYIPYPTCKNYISIEI